MDKHIFKDTTISLQPRIRLLYCMEVTNEVFTQIRRKT